MEYLHTPPVQAKWRAGVARARARAARVRGPGPAAWTSRCGCWCPATWWAPSSAAAAPPSATSRSRAGPGWMCTGGGSRQFSSVSL